MYPGYTKILTHPNIIKSLVIDTRRKKIFYVADGVYLYSFSKDMLDKIADGEYSSATIICDNMLYLGGFNGILVSIVWIGEYNIRPSIMLVSNNINRLPIHVNSIYHQDRHLFLTMDDRVVSSPIVGGVVENIAGCTTKSMNVGDIIGSSSEARFNELRGMAIHNKSIYLCDYRNYKIKVLKDNQVSNFDIYSFVPDGSLYSLKFTNGFTHIGFSTRGNMVLSSLRSLLVIDINTHVILFNHCIDRKLITSMIIDSLNNIYISLKNEDSDTCTLYRVNIMWITHRLLWIGHTKKNGNESPLSSLPRDIIREICSYLLL